MSEEVKTQAQQQPAVAAPAPVAEEKKDVMASVVHKDTDPVVSAKELLAVGAHYGHQARRWNPTMKPYIYAKRNNAHIIDLNKTAECIQKAYLALKKIVEDGGKVLFVGTKPIAKDVILAEATRSGSFYVNNRWLGGTLTNFKTISHRIRLLKTLQDEADEGLLDKLSKKEAAGKNKQREKLTSLLGGIKDLRKVPNAIVFVDTVYEHNAVHEAKLLHIPSFGLVDTNGDPSVVNFPIPVNCEGPESVKLVIGLLADAVVAGKGGEVEYAYKDGSADAAAMKDILPAQFNPDELKVIRAKIREDIFEAKKKGKKHRKVSKKKFVKKFGPRPSADNKPQTASAQLANATPAAKPADVKPAAPVSKPEVK